MLFKNLVDILLAYKSSMTAGGAGAMGQLAISENMKMLPVLILGLLKNVRFCHCSEYADAQLRAGWYPPECPDTSRHQGVRTSSAHVSALSTPYALHLPDVLLAAQHARRGMTDSYGFALLADLDLGWHCWARGHYPPSPASAVF